MGLDGFRVVSFESRRSEEMARLIEKHGGIAIRAPAMREVPLSDQAEALAFGEALFAGECDVLVLLTGVGTRMLVDALSTRHTREEVVARLGASALVCRGPKPVVALRALGLRATVTVPEPNTWRDVVSTLDRELSVANKRVFVQEYGARNDDLLDALRARGATVRAVPIYAWRLPEDVEPLRSAIRRLVERAADAVLVTSGHQIDHLFEVARDLGLEESLRAAFAEHVVVASIGPMTTEALERHRLAADVHPKHPKMGHLVLALAERGPGAAARKRGTRPS